MEIPLKATNLITHFFKTTFTWINIFFTQITLTLILPLTFISIAHTFSPNLLKNPNDQIIFTFTFTFTHPLSDLIISTMIFFSFHIWAAYLTPASDNHNNNTFRHDVTLAKLVLNLLLRLILTFLFVYFVTIFGDNLMVAVVGLTDTIVFTIYVVWYAVLHTYLVGVLVFLTVMQLALVKAVEAWVDVETVFLKVLGGYLVNGLVMTPLISSNVGEEMMPPVWGLMIGRLFGVLFLPTFVFQIVHLIRFIRQPFPAAN
ncbi:hypothetical protein Hanom_Chr05g00469921 [Helianthus anomalus]